MVKRVLCLDVGEKRIGVAVTDPLGITAQPVKTIFTKGEKNDLDEVRRLASEYETDRLLLGLPLSLSGAEGYQVARVRDFAKGLEGFDVRFYDERLTSKSAERTLLEANVSRKKRKDNIDKLAATYILQAFMDAGGWRENKPDMTDKNSAEGGHMDEMENNIVELIDEDGNAVRFEYIMTVPYEGDEYVVLAEENEELGDDDEQEVIIMRIEPGEEDDEYVQVEDEEVLDKVFNLFLSMVDDEDDEDEDE